MHEELYGESLVHSVQTLTALISAGGRGVYFSQNTLLTPSQTRLQTAQKLAQAISYFGETAQLVVW